MKTAFVLFFILLGILQVGILLSAWSAYRSQYKPTSLKYWSIALGISATSYFCFAVTLGSSEELLSKSNFMMTVANVLVVAGVLFQGLFARALRTEITPKLIKTFLVLMAIYAIAFEFTRGHTSFETRTIFVGLMLFFIYLWQLFEITRTKKFNNSLQLKVLLGLVALEAIFILLRVVVIYVANAHVQTLAQVPPLASLLLWLQLTLNILAYVSMVAFWYEEVTKATVVAEYENVKMKSLLEEKDQLLTNLVKTKKIAELGALSASIAHEINQPLGALKINTWMLEKTNESEKNFNELQAKLVNSITRDMQRVADIVSTLRTVFKSEGYAATRIDLAQWLDKLKSIVALDLEGRDIKITYEVPQGLMLDVNEGELTLVFLNLISNASRALSKINRAEGHIFVQASQEFGAVYLTVADNGPGVPEALVEQLFEIAKDSQSSGLGLGLWLSRYIVERAAGTLNYRANNPHGSVFTVRFQQAN